MKLFSIQIKIINTKVITDRIAPIGIKFNAKISKKLTLQNKLQFVFLIGL